MLQINPLLCLQGSSGSLLQAHARTPQAFAQHSQWGACHLSAPLPLCSVRALSSAGSVFPPPHMPSPNRRPHSGLCQCPPCICFPQPVRGKASLRPLCVLTERPHPSLPCTTVTCVCADLPTRGHPCSRGAGIKSALPLHRSMLRPALHRGLSEVIAKPN